MSCMKNFSRPSCRQNGMTPAALISTPESVGVPGSSLVLGKHSGKHALSQRLAKLGYQPDPERMSEIFAQFKAAADLHGEINDADLVAMMEGYSASGSQWTVLRTELRTELRPARTHHRGENASTK